jgi:hypothetical protein
MAQGKLAVSSAGIAPASSSFGGSRPSSDEELTASATMGLPTSKDA